MWIFLLYAAPELACRAAQVPHRVVTQAVFKKAQKAAKAAPAKAASATKKLQKSAPSPVKRVQSAAKKVHSQHFVLFQPAHLPCTAPAVLVRHHSRSCGEAAASWTWRGCRPVSLVCAGAEGVAGEEGGFRAEEWQQAHQGLAGRRGRRAGPGQVVWCAPRPRAPGLFNFAASRCVYSVIGTTALCLNLWPLTRCGPCPGLALL